MPKITFTFEGEPHEFHHALRQMGLTAADPIYACSTADILQTVTDRAQDLAEKTEELHGIVIGDSPEQLKHGTPDGKPAQELEETITGPHSSEDIKEALAAAAKAEAEEKRKAAADKRAKKAEEKRKAEAASAANAAATAVEAEVVADPNGASLDALLSQDTETEIPEHLTETAKDAGPAATVDDDLSALLGDAGSTASEDDTTDDLRAKFAAMEPAELNAEVRELMKRKGVPWLKAVLAEAKKPNLGQMSKEEMIEVLVKAD